MLRMEGHGAKAPGFVDFCKVPYSPQTSSSELLLQEGNTCCYLRCFYLGFSALNSNSYSTRVWGVPRTEEEAHVLALSRLSSDLWVSPLQEESPSQSHGQCPQVPTARGVLVIP